MSERDYDMVCKRIRHGTAEPKHEKVYQNITGRSSSSIAKESSEKRDLRLEKERIRNAKRLKSETEEETSRRKEANRIRMRLCRYRRNPLSEKEWVHLTGRLKTLCKYPSIRPTGWWVCETYEQYKTRCANDILRHKKRELRKREEEDAERFFVRAVHVVNLMEGYEKKLSTLQKDDGMCDCWWSSLHIGPRRPLSVCDAPYCRHTLDCIRSTKGMLFKLDNELSTIESNLKICLRNRKRPQWIVTPPSGSNENDKIQEVKIPILCKVETKEIKRAFATQSQIDLKANCGWKFVFTPSNFEWSAERCEWLLSDILRRRIISGYVISRCDTQKICPKTQYLLDTFDLK